MIRDINEAAELPLTLSFEVSEMTPDYTAILTHDFIPGLRLTLNREQWEKFCAVDWGKVTQDVFVSNGYPFG